MLNEWNEFQDYTGVVNYTARNKQDTTHDNSDIPP